MDKNTIIGIVLIVLIVVAFGYFNKPSKKEAERLDKLRDSIEKVEEQKQLETIREKQQAPNNQAIVKADTSTGNSELLKEQYGTFSGSATGKNSFIVLENNLIRLKICTKGGRPYSVQLKEYKTYKRKPLLLFDGDSTIFGFEFFAQNRDIFTNQFFFKPVSHDTLLIAKDKPQQLTLRLYAQMNKYIEYTYSIQPNSYQVDFNVQLVKMDSIIASNTAYLDLIWQMYSPQQEKGADNENNYTTIAYKHFDNEVQELNARSKEKVSKEISTKIKWIAFKQQFFSWIMVANEDFTNINVEHTRMDTSTHYIKFFKAKASVDYNPANPSVGLHFYFGPNRYNVMKSYKQDYEKLIPLGKSIIKYVNTLLVIPVFNFLDKYIGNYGLVILLLTIFIKIIIFPLTYRSYLSTTKMRVLKPQVDELNKKFPKQEDAMKKQQATMALYKKVGVNPLGGCLPMVIQFPILVAMFRFFPASIELRQKSFLWADDLSSYDSILNLPFNIPFYGDHISLFTLLMTISTIIYTIVNNQITAAQNTQLPGMKFMMYIMPVMFMFWFNNYASGLSYYYFLANMLTFAQMYIMKQFVDDEELLKKLHENAKKTVKKSSFQERLEKMARQRGYKPSK